MPYGSLTVIRAPYDDLTAVGAQIGSTDEILTEGCPHPECEDIHVYDIKSDETFIAFENVKPHAVCAGPPGTLLVWDRKTNKLIQLVYKAGNANYIHEIKFQENPLPFFSLLTV